jgi:hypothetical protein
MISQTPRKRGEEVRPVGQESQGDEPQAIKDLAGNKSLAVQMEEQHDQGVALRFFECEQEIGAVNERQGGGVVEHVAEVDGGWHQTAQDYHQHREVVIYFLKQEVKSKRDENHDGPNEQVAGDAETEECLVGGDVVGRCGGVAMNEQLARNIDEADRAGEGEEQVEESRDSPGLRVELMRPPL